MGKCPSDAGDLIIRQSRYGKRFLGCSNDDCKINFNINATGLVQMMETAKSFKPTWDIQAIEVNQKYKKRNILNFFMF